MLLDLRPECLSSLKGTIRNKPLCGEPLPGSGEKTLLTKKKTVVFNGRTMHSLKALGRGANTLNVSSSHIMA